MTRLSTRYSPSRARSLDDLPPDETAGEVLQPRHVFHDEHAWPHGPEQLDEMPVEAVAGVVDDPGVIANL